ncbi:PAS domain S-box protein, partial [candidate division KSB3 bacterium]|nr:PAS domain S-box protein [candidate division KSB3 bacterium]MBD3325336.1 PAS domain S-box protein [candidate division KSB3 bacterium]
MRHPTTQKQGEGTPMDTQKSILIIDDEPQLLQGFVRVLQRAGYAVQGTPTGAEGMRLAQMLAPDLILLDVVLQDTPGLEVCRQLRALPELHATSILLFSGVKTSSEEQAQGLETGADGYILKPVSNRELLARVEAMFRIKDAEMKLSKALEDLQQQHETLLATQHQLKTSQQKYASLYHLAPIGYCTLNEHGVILEANSTLADQLGVSRKQLINRYLTDFIAEAERQTFLAYLTHVFTTSRHQTCDVRLQRHNSPHMIAHLESLVINEHPDQPPHCRTAVTDITTHKRTEVKLRETLKETQKQQAEMTALLRASRAVLEYHSFQDAAQCIFNVCKDLIGATSGYVALLSEDGAENEVLFLDAGGLPCTVDPELPMPIRGLRSEAYYSRSAVYDNDFAHSQWMQFMPDGHVHLENVLFAPLIIHETPVGLLGIANKPGGFTDRDASIAAAFGELAAIALYNSQTLESLERSEERFRSVAQTAGDAIVNVDQHGTITFWNVSAQRIFGYAMEEIIGKPVTVIIPRRFHDRYKQELRHVISTNASGVIGAPIELTSVKKSGVEFPVELSVARWNVGEEKMLTYVIRDIT